MNQKTTKLLFISGVILAMVFSANCFLANPTTTDADRRPTDFAVEYNWRRGSVPPPNHYEYSILIKSDGRGEIAMVPNYPSETVPKWTEQFTLDSEKLDELYRQMFENKLFTNVWQQAKEQRVGGDNQDLTVTAGLRNFTIKDYLIPEQQTAAAAAIYQAVNRTVPKAIWDKLNAQRQQYAQEYSRSSN